MNVLLGHFDFSTLFYGFIIFIGLSVMLYKFLKGAWFSLIIDIAVFALVFKLHGGTMSGGYAATIAALCAGMFFPTMIRRVK